MFIKGRKAGLNIYVRQKGTVVGGAGDGLRLIQAFQGWCAVAFTCNHCNS